MARKFKEGKERQMINLPFFSCLNKISYHVKRRNKCIKGYIPKT